MQAQRTLPLDHNGAKKFLERNGENLICARYRYDEQRRSRREMFAGVFFSSTLRIPTRISIRSSYATLSIGAHPTLTQIVWLWRPRSARMLHNWRASSVRSVPSPGRSGTAGPAATVQTASSEESMNCGRFIQGYKPPRFPSSRAALRGRSCDWSGWGALDMQEKVLELSRAIRGEEHAGTRIAMQNLMETLGDLTNRFKSHDSKECSARLQALRKQRDELPSRATGPSTLMHNPI
jgi:hypothetical protein